MGSPRSKDTKVKVEFILCCDHFKVQAVHTTKQNRMTGLAFKLLPYAQSLNVTVFVRTHSSNPIAPNLP